MIRKYYIDCFREWLFNNESFSEILRHYTNTSYLTNNWSVYYNGMINAGNIGNPLIPIKRTEHDQYFRRGKKVFIRVRIEYADEVEKAKGDLW